MYAKLSEDRQTIRQAPRAMRIGNSIVCNPTPAQYEAAGYKRVLQDDPPQAEEGRYVRPTGYDEDEKTIWRTYEQAPLPPAPPRTFSKFALEGKLFEEGLMASVDAIIDSQVITNSFGQTMPLRRRYDTALVFREDHPDFARVLSAIKQALGVSDEKAEEILAASTEEE